MKPLAQIKNPKGQLLSPITQAILTHLQNNGPCSDWDIDQVLININGYADDSAMSGLHHRLRNLRFADQIHRVLRDDRMLWKAGPAPTADKPSPAPGVTPPRQHNVMHGPCYEQGWAVPRAGAMDYAHVPSLHMGQRREFRSELV